ncbi:DNA methyltransferase [Frisingicoccus sp.]|uniref:DNA methyltransferase n=1 Tax=Frisingicoccus sp. TaxID=1918627 RepID=UPI003AB29CE6
MRYILHYTKPGDIVLDGFCGTGMTGVAANMCDHPENAFKALIDAQMPYVKWGKRFPVISDLSPIAAFISKNYNADINVAEFVEEANEVLKLAEKECTWMYETDPVQTEMSSFIPQKGRIIYTVWSDVFICPNCGKEIVFYEAAADEKTGKVSNSFLCPSCNAKLKKGDCERSFESYFDDDLGEIHSIIKQKPVLIKYELGKKRYNKKPDENDLRIIQKIEADKIPYWYPTNRLREGKESRRNDKIGITHVHHFFYKRTLYVLAKIFDLIKERKNSDLLKIMFTSQIINISKMNRFRPQVSFPYNPLSGTMYVSSMVSEANPFNAYSGKVAKFADALKSNKDNTYCISTGSTTNLLINDNTCDYIFTDPPFGDNLNYSELSFLWESWLGIITNEKFEAIINPTMGKSLPEYQGLMTRCFMEYYRVLKPNRWMTVEFHNSKNAVWNAIQEALQRSGFIVADVRTLDKQGGSFKQVTTTSAVKQDLVISAYKPKESFHKEFLEKGGTEEAVWVFVDQHLSNLPVVVDADKNGKIDIVAERQAFLLFDRMIAYHIMSGLPVPMDSADFYKGLDERYLQRDSMYFLIDQVNEYDMARIKMDVEPVQFDLFVTNEKSAIAWLYQQLDEPKTYAEIQPRFMQEIKAVDKFEDMPELQVILEENFIQDEKGRWYIPDVRKEGDVAKLREKKLWKEFEGYLASKGKLKLFRSEAIRVGFGKLWKDKNYQAIVDMAERLPERTVQEDPNILMYYDISLSRI